VAYLFSVIFLPSVQPTVYQKPEGICAALSQAAGIPFEPGIIPEGWFNCYQDDREINRQKVRDALVSTFASRNSGTNLSWKLFYGSGTKRYVLNIHLVRRG
jgi:hypothetical protein